MSLNRYEQAVFDYVAGHPDEHRFWLGKISAATRVPGTSGEVARALERDLWDYFAERSQHVPALRELNTGGLRRLSFLNLAEHLLRRWGPPPKSNQRPPGLS
ncbi:MAG: hypothetical protein JWQ62_2303 [Lacunisphaera sp.]|nr:hypothetical protein [Lacunisphaera sp.]